MEYLNAYINPVKILVDFKFQVGKSVDFKIFKFLFMFENLTSKI